MRSVRPYLGATAGARFKGEGTNTKGLPKMQERMVGCSKKARAAAEESRTQGESRFGPCLRPDAWTRSGQS